VLEYTKTETEINSIRDRVLADIKAKHNAKQGKREREDQENDNPNKKPKLDVEEKDA
jgi:hypothetical protein